MGYGRRQYRRGQFLVTCAFLAVLLLGTGAARAAEGNLSLSAGYRVDSLDWNIAADFFGASPNILSELSWEDIQSFQVGAEAEIVKPYRDRVSTVLLGRASYGWIVAGDNQDSDYAGNNRTLEWSRSNNDAGAGHVFDLEGGVGIRFGLADERWSLMPQLGYAYYEQGLTMRDGYQTLSDPGIASSGGFPSPLPVGPFPGLDSTYLAWWSGPWLGLQADYRQNDLLSWDVRLRWHRVDYRAEANWNLRSDLRHPISFEQEADGDGFSLAAGMQYAFDEEWQFGADLALYDLQADNGLDIVYLDNGSVGGTRLNEANWQSWALSLALQYRFW